MGYGLFFIVWIFACALSAWTAFWTEDWQKIRDAFLNADGGE
ncbi:hypothetical protein N9L75_03650 [Porticoccaceae bacterium]|nr:hypothetical protein [Porticoccaceae bacterium]MDA8651650.1 hypothetical protein [Porticoccaceae bacterium]MDA8682406.1 hypothetical protein [Porticoccaceae bacterium]MDB2343123.1 hypothetical protein [Porticoccaceae bacterium]MDB2664455.1 hypothetical protein [Porticoccaceae bacterium]